MINKYNHIVSLENPIWEIMESISIKENHDRLVPTSLSSLIKTYPIYYKMGVKHSIPECFVRESVFEKLIQAAIKLPKGINLVVLDGWRPYEVQKCLFDTLLNNFKNDPDNEGTDIEELISMTRNIVAPARKNSSCPSPHLTGGAVDVSLCDDAGRLLDMGSMFDENSPLSWTAALENKNDYKNEAAINNRRMLYHVMIESGFSNFPSEWWHYDYGDQLWAYYTGKKSALYGAAKPIELTDLWSTKHS